MGIAISSNSRGVNNVNAFVSQTVGNDEFKTLAGLFANINVDGALILRGVFGEVYVLGNSLSLSYALITSYAANFQTSLRLNIFKDANKSYDVNIYNNETRLMEETFQVSRFGGNLSWSCSKGHVVTIGVCHSRLFNTTSVEAGFKVNIWKTETGSSRFDISTNISRFLTGPLEGHQDMVASITFSHAF